MSRGFDKKGRRIVDLNWLTSSDQDLENNAAPQIEPATAAKNFLTHFARLDIRLRAPARHSATTPPFPVPPDIADGAVFYDPRGDTVLVDACASASDPEADSTLSSVFAVEIESISSIFSTRVTPTLLPLDRLTVKRKKYLFCDCKETMQNNVLKKRGFEFGCNCCVQEKQSKSES